MKLIKPWFDPEDKRNYFSITWNLTRKCNSHCPFCFYHEPNHNEETLIDPNLVFKFLSQLNLNKYDHTNIKIFGGEPTQHKSFMDIMMKLRLNYNFNDIILYSNLTGNLDNYKVLSELNVEQIFTYHPNLLSFNEYKTRISELDPNKTQSIIMEDNGLEESYYNELIKILPPQNVRILKIHLRSAGILSHQDEVKDQTKCCQDSDGNYVTPSRVSNDGSEDFRGWKCCAGRNLIFIEENGDIFPCQEQGQDYYRKKDSNIKPIGNIRDLQFNPEYTICISRACRSDLWVTKEKMIAT